MPGCHKDYNQSMILPLHIVIVLTSVIYTAVIYFSPTHKKLNISYALVVMTIASGTWLVVANPAHMVQSCISGLVYIGGVFFAIALARRKLAAEQE